MNIYDDMQSALTDEVNNVASQGVIVYNAPGTPGDPFTAPTSGLSYPVKGWNITGRTRNKYIDAGYIIASDLLIAVVPFAVKPEVSGTITVNGVEHQIVMVDGATIDPDKPVVWRIGCRK